MQYKRGLSAVVTTLIIILLVMVSIAIVWIVIGNVIQSGAEELSLGKFTVDAEISNVNLDNSTNNISLNVKRKVGQGNISGIKFIFYTNTGSESIEEDISLQELETRNFNFHLNTNVNQLVRISIVPIFTTSSEKKVIGNIMDTHTVGGGGGGSSCTSDCTGRVCGSDGCGGSCGICSGSQYCSSGTCIEGTNPCVLTTALWSDSEVVEGTLVTLNVTGTNCSGSDINFTIYENEAWPVSDEFVQSNIVTDMNSTWITVWFDDGGLDPDPEYFFTASVLDNPSEEVTSPDLSVTELVSAYCGNNIIDGTDVCDGTDLDSQTCVTQGYDSGTLTCLSDCTGFNFTSCVNDTCTPDCSCASTTCTGSTCSDGCGGTCAGTLAPDCGARECGAAPNGCGTASQCGTCSGSESCVGGTCTEAMTCNNISQFGITWTFDTTYQCGQFVNGDWWVVGPVDIVSVNPPCTENAGHIMNGAMINPNPNNDREQGYDNGLWGPYENPGSGYLDSRNVVRNISGANPLSIVTGSLVSAISFEEFQAWPQLELVAILTVLDSVPPEDSFRPSYTGEDKSVLFNKLDIDYSRLGTLSSGITTLSPADMIDEFEYPWLDHVPNWMEERLSHSNMPDYGREKSGIYGEGTLLANLDFSTIEKETLVVRLIQIGIDDYGIAQEREDVWINNGGHANGRLWPIIFAGLMLNDSDMINIRDNQNIWFGETDQLFYVDNDVISTGTGYTTADLGLPEWGIEHRNRPYNDNKEWDLAYRRCCTAYAFSGEVLSSYIMGAEDLWQKNSLLEYMDRYLVIEEGDNLQFFGGQDGLTANMWRTYRDDYTCLYSDLNTVAHTRIFNCSNVFFDCNDISSCGNYPNQQAIDHDPCDVC